MSNERYERVTAAELKVGDVVLDIRYGVQSEWIVNQDEVNIIQGAPEFYPKSLRRLIPTNEEAVLRRALENELISAAKSFGYGEFNLEKIASDLIDQARRELAAEASGAKGGER